MKGAIPLGFVMGVAVKSDAVARQTEPLLLNWPKPPRDGAVGRPSLSVEPLLFDKDELLRTIRGHRC